MYIANHNYSEIFSKFSEQILAISDDSKNKIGELNASQVDRYKLERKIEQALFQHKWDEVRLLVEEFSVLHKERLSRTFPLRTLKNYSICSCAIFTRKALETGLDETFFYGLSDWYIEKIESCQTHKSLNELISVMFIDYLKEIEKRQWENNLSSCVQKALIFLNENWQKNISLQDIASAIYINSSYLARCFKRDLGCTVTAFLHNKRIGVAKELLVKTNKSIAEISEWLGYQDQSYFNKCFKSIVKMSPRQFQKSSEEITQ